MSKIHGGGKIWLAAFSIAAAAAVTFAAKPAFAPARPAPAPVPAKPPVTSTSPKGPPTFMSTFHCLSVYWSPEGGTAGKNVLVKFRESTQKDWRDGLPMRYNPIPTPECKGDYRGSIVNLKPGTSYEVALALEGTDKRAIFTAATWAEKFPAASTVKCTSSGAALNVNRSGKPDAYVVYDGTGATIDTANKADFGILVNASYVVLRGFTIKNVKQHGILLADGNHIVIEDCDISYWGSEAENGFGVNLQAGVSCSRSNVFAVVVQRCKIHHPTWNTNSWAVKRRKDNPHPSGPQTIAFWEAEGNNVIRYNELWSDPEHYYNDVVGAGRNSSFRGFPGADSDIYCNYIANCWDDGIEAEGGGQNVRVWNNYIENTMMAVADASVSVGPLYVWQNVTGRSYTPPGSAYSLTHGNFMKMGCANSETWMTGHMYVFNNTIFQPKGEGYAGLGGDAREIKHCISRNNIFNVRPEDRHCISISSGSVDDDFDYDLLSAGYPADQEKHGVKGVPRYVPGAGFSFETKTGNFQLAPGSPGYTGGVAIPNFCDALCGGAHIGAQPPGSGPMRVGVKAVFVPPMPPVTAAGT